MDWTAAVAFDARVCSPRLLEAVTRKRMRDPTSSAESVYAVVVAPEIVVQLEPSGSPPSSPQRTHWYANEIGATPAQVPALAKRIRPWTAVPLIDGSVVARGGPLVVDCCTTALGFEATVAEPTAFVAVTWTRRRCPMSAEASV